MDDEFMQVLKREPRRAFAEELYGRIDTPMKANRLNLFGRWASLTVVVAGAVLVAALFVFPPAQAWAQDFLNLFRVKRFTAVSVDPARLQQLSASKVDIQAMVGTDMQVVQDPGAPQPITLDAAQSLSSMRVRVPSALPPDLAISDVRLQGEGVVKVTADGEKLQSLLDTLGITDVNAPAKLNGATITIHTPAHVMMSLRNAKTTVAFVQARSPEVTLPDGVALSDLGLIGLRVIGFSPADAKQFAQTIDWNATLIVPVPANAASFREVNIGNAKGLMITTNSSAAGPIAKPGLPTRPENILLWSDGEMVFGLSGDAPAADLLTIAAGLK